MRGRQTVLDGLSLRIGADEHVAILGPNGCGKSTLIKTITRECYPLAQDGSAMTILGEDSWDVFSLRKMLGIVSNDWMQLCTREATGKDIVLSGFFSSTNIFPNHEVMKSQQKQAANTLERLGAAHLADRPMFEMSSGEARRMLIARALVHNPRALLFDEPCNSLDFAAQQIVRETMRVLARSGIGIILVTHELADVVPEIERVVLMNRGRIVADGPTSELLVENQLSELFGVAVGIERRDGHYHLR